MTDCTSCGFPNPDSVGLVACRNCGTSPPEEPPRPSPQLPSDRPERSRSRKSKLKSGRQPLPAWGVGLIVIGSLLSLVGIAVMAVFSFQVFFGGSSATVSVVGAAIRVPPGEYEVADDGTCHANVTEAEIVVWHNFLTMNLDTVDVELGPGTVDGAFCRIGVDTPPVAVSHIVDFKFGECRWRLSNDPESGHAQYALRSNPKGPASIDLGTFTYPICS